jgi:hypothetical protein
MILLAIVNMAIFLDLLGATLRTRVSHTSAHGHLQLSTCYRLVILPIHTMAA